MNACYCTLPYSNPNACEGCPNNTERWNIQPFIWTQPAKDPWKIESVVEKYITGKYYVVTHVEGPMVANHICYCYKALSPNYTMTSSNKEGTTFIFDNNGKWVNHPGNHSTEIAYVVDKPYNSQEEAKQALDGLTVKQPAKKEKKEPKMKNKLDETTLKECIDKIVSILTDAGETFTPHIVTQILRKTDAFVAHQDVREYFDELDEKGWEEVDYVVGYSYVNNSPAKSRVYYIEDSAGDTNEHISISIDGFSAEIEYFLKWFNKNYEYEEDSEIKVPSVGPITISEPAGANSIYYVKDPVKTLSISGSIGANNWISGSTSLTTPVTSGQATLKNAGWANWKNMKRDANGKWVSK